MRPLKGTAFALSAAFALSGCATNQMYDWGRYDTMLYRSYVHPDKTGELRVEIEEKIAALDKEKSKVPPGLYAELGTLYMQSGDMPKAVAAYSRERDVWPESRGFMDALIKNLETSKPKSSSQDGKEKS